MRSSASSKRWAPRSRPWSAAIGSWFLSICCGSCFFCSRGLFSNCHNVNPNAAEFVRDPFADVGPSVVPDWLSSEDALLLPPVFGTAQPLHGVSA